MFTLCKSRYQALLLKQRWNYLNQRCAVYHTAGVKMRSICSDLKLCNFSMISVALQRFRQPFLRSKPWKENWLSERRPFQWGTLVRIVYKNNFKNFFQMTMLFLAYVVTILRQLHFTRNYFFKVNISAERLLP